jgi:hypothetical protein
MIYGYLEEKEFDNNRADSLDGTQFQRYDAQIASERLMAGLD